MPIPVTCPACGCRMRAPDNAAGKSSGCPKCKTKLVIPAGIREAKSVPSSPATGREVPQTAPMRTISCLACFNPVGVPADATGTVVTCPKCRTTFVVPAPSSNNTFGVVVEPDPPRPPHPAPATGPRDVSAEAIVNEAERHVDRTSGRRAPLGSTRPCKYCDRPVAPNARKCPGCGGKSPYPLSPQEWLMGCAGFAVIVVIFMACCTGDEKKSDQSPSRGETPSPGRTGLPIEVVEVRLEPFRAATGFDTQLVCVDWKNTSDRPVRVVRARIRAFDDRGIEVYSVPSYTIYAVLSNNQPGVAPGETYRKPSDQGFVLPKDAGLSAVWATVDITSADERLRD